MQRFFAEPGSIDLINQRIRLTGSDVNHIRNVLRMKNGEELWVSDGENWTPLGLFPYDENGTVHVQVYLPEPMDIAAIATYAHCHAPNMFDFRQTATDFLLEK